MLQNIIIWAIIAFCAFYLGKRYYRQWRSAVSSEADSGCIETSCCGCSSSSSCASALQARKKPTKK